jgi:hypothetical protein
MMTSKPHRFRMARLSVLLVLLMSVLNVSGSSLPGSAIMSIEPASTWVGLARVYLEIDDLRQDGELLEGTYKLRVPLAPKQNDAGRVELHAPGLLEDLGTQDATVIGSAVSTSGKVHDFVARMRPNGVVKIEVVTAERTLRFKSRYAASKG